MTLEILVEQLTAAFGSSEYIDQYVSLVLTSTLGPGEHHHILMKSVFGKNDLTVKLTVKDHMLAHFLLYKACKNSNNARLKQKCASAFTSFNRKNRNRLKKITVDDFARTTDDFIDWSCELRQANSIKNVGCTHYTNMLTGKVIFAKESPIGDEWIRGNKHNKRPYIDPKNPTKEYWLTEQDDIGELVLGRSFSHKGRHHCIDASGKHVFVKEINDSVTKTNSMFVNVATHKHKITHQIKRFPNDWVADGDWEPYSPTLGKVRAYCPDTLEYRTLFVDNVPDGWIIGVPESVYQNSYADRRFVKEVQTGKLRKIRNNDMSDDYVKAGPLSGRLIIYNEETFEHTSIDQFDDIPVGWRRGRANMPRGFKIYTHTLTLEQKRIHKGDSLPSSDWVQGTAYDRNWVSYGADEKLVNNYEIEHYLSIGWVVGRHSLKNNKNNSGNTHIHNPITLERKTIKNVEELPVGWVVGLLKKSNPALKGKKAFHDPISKDVIYVTDIGDVPPNYIRGTGKTKNGTTS